MDQQVYPNSVFIVKILGLVPALCDSGGEHSICFPSVDLLLLLGGFSRHAFSQFLINQGLFPLLVNPRKVRTAKRVMCLVAKCMAKFVSFIPVSVHGGSVFIVVERLWPIKYLLVWF